MPWFVYTSDTIDTKTNYVLSHAEPCCPDGEHLCAIFAEDDTNGYPIITENILTGISDALNYKKPIPGSVLLKP